ncbi:MAG: S24 family peptidase [bacterium]
MKKKFWKIFTIIVVALIVVVALWVKFMPASMLSYFKNQNNLISNTLCSYPVRVAGDSMSPTFKSGEVVNFNKCFDKENLFPNQIIVFKNPGSLKIGLIREIQKDNNIIYIVSPEARIQNRSDVSSEDIVAIYKK